MNQWFYDSSTQKFNGLSTDTKPTGCNSGSIFNEIDTGLQYIYNANDESWTEISNGGGGGGIPEQEITTDGVPPLSFESNGTPASAYMIYADMVQSGTPSSATPAYPQELGDLVTSGEHVGKYAITMEIGGTTKPYIWMSLYENSVTT